MTKMTWKDVGYPFVPKRDRNQSQRTSSIGRDGDQSSGCSSISSISIGNTIGISIGDAVGSNIGISIAGGGGDVVVVGELAC